METHHKIAGIIIRNKKLLMCRKYDEPHFIMPGGKLESGETPKRRLEIELKEEIGLKLVDMKYWNTYQAVHFKDKNKLIVMETYLISAIGNPKPGNEINELKWVDSSYKKQRIKLASINEDYLIPELKNFSLID